MEYVEDNINKVMTHFRGIMELTHHGNDSEALCINCRNLLSFINIQMAASSFWAQEHGVNYDASGNFQDAVEISGHTCSILSVVSFCLRYGKKNSKQDIKNEVLIHKITCLL